MRILDPRATTTTKEGGQQAAPWVASLDGVSISVIDDSKPKFDIFAAALLDELEDKFGAKRGLSFAKPNAGNKAPQEWYEQIRDLGGVALVGWGDCGGCSTHTFLDTAELVGRGVPAVAVISEPFTSLIDLLARTQSLQHVPCLVLPHPPTSLSDSELQDLARERAADVAQIYQTGVTKLFNRADAA